MDSFYIVKEIQPKIKEHIPPPLKGKFNTSAKGLHPGAINYSENSITESHQNMRR